MTAHLDISNPIASYWLSAASTGFAGPTTWRTWADSLIDRLEQPPLWIINMSLAKSLDELYLALEERKQQEDNVLGYMIPLGNAKLGFYYLRYEKGEYTLDRFLASAGDEADGGTADLPCEVVFEILNALERARDDNSTLEILARKAKDLFSPYKRIAEEQWAAIQSVVSQ